MALVEVHGLTELRSALDASIAGLDAAVNRALLEIAEAIAARAHELVPVDTGALQRSLSVKQRRQLEAIIEMLYYGFYVEYGTSKMRAQPFIRPSIDAVTNHLSQILWKHLAPLFSY